MGYGKKLPSGVWLFIRQLAPETTDQDLSEFFHQLGFDIPVDRCSVKEFGNYATGMISVHNNQLPEQLSCLFTWAATGKQLNGREVKVESTKPELVRRA